MEGLEWLKERNLNEHRIKVVSELKKLADEMGTSVAKLSIAWCAKNPNVSTVILGASKEQHLKETLTSLDLVPKLDNDIMIRIEHILGNTPRRPDF
jgi:aryl-alcohol dehydrogenase-like predicted oxidoreductase